MTTKEFIQYASERPELCVKMSTCTAPEEAYAIAKEAGLTDDIDTFKVIMIKTKAEAEKLSEDDLNQVNAAGTGTNSVIITTAAGTALASTAAAFIAI